MRNEPIQQDIMSSFDVFYSCGPQLGDNSMIYSTQAFLHDEQRIIIIGPRGDNVRTQKRIDVRQ